MARRRLVITALSKRLLGAEDRKMSNRIMRLLYDDLGCPGEIDAIRFLHMELASLYLVRMSNALTAGRLEIAESFNRMACLHLKALMPSRRRHSESEKARK